MICIKICKLLKASVLSDHTDPTVSVMAQDAMEAIMKKGADL
jgi:hypothetical protein